MVSWNCMDLSDLGLGLKQGERDTRNSNYVMGWFIRQQGRVKEEHYLRVRRREFSAEVGVPLD